jgi:hypothetical protein
MNFNAGWPAAKTTKTNTYTNPSPKLKPQPNRPGQRHSSQTQTTQKKHLQTRQKPHKL